MSLTKEQVAKAKLRLDSVRYPSEVGEDLYMGSPEVTHQLHCLVRPIADRYRHDSHSTNSRTSCVKQRTKTTTETNLENGPIALRRLEPTWVMLLGNINSGRSDLETDHCIEMLRQVLMCNADTGVLTMNWVESHSQPYERLSRHHK